MSKKVLIILSFISICLVGGGLYAFSLDRQIPSITLAPGLEREPAPSFSPTVERQKVYEQEIKVTLGDRIVLGKITDVLADLGTIKWGDKASYEILIRNSEDEPVRIAVNTTGNISAVIDFNYPELIEPLSSEIVTVHISGKKRGFYTGFIIVERANEK